MTFRLSEKIDLIINVNHERDSWLLSKLKKVDLREEWQHEATDFTNWLAQDENLQLLSEEIGIDITLVQTEASVGKFSVDILAEEENTGRKIVIENQLETTNHDHLGKIITYASGFDAEIVIWIVKDVRDEQIRCEFYIPDSKPLFKLLHDSKEAIEAKLPAHELEWMELEGKKASRVRTVNGIDVGKNENWEKSFNWLMESAQEYQSVFAEQMKKMKI
ncbi:MAG: DUF4268 domain-containing protein [Pseudomonadota bacterium]